MKHHGKIVEKAVKESGYTKGYVAEQMRHTPKTLWRKFQEKNLSKDYLIKIYKVIGRDISSDLP